MVTPRDIVQGHPLAMNSFFHWLRVLRWGGHVDRKYLGRALFVSCVSPLYWITRLGEQIKFREAISSTAIHKDPIFIIGHWRSGTTHLHNLLTQDPQFGYVTTLQSQAPKTFLIGRRSIRPFMTALMPRTRPMDNVAIDTEFPQEEEYCLCNATMLSFYLYNFFPKRSDDSLFRKWVLFEGVSEAEFDSWQAEYTELVKKATLHMGGRQLVLKNPCNTARLEAVLRIFPQAKFIHIYRNPYEVYKSTLRLREKFPELTGFQDADAERRRRDVIEHYRLMMRRFFECKERVPAGQFAEVRYEDLEERPLQELERLYGALGLKGWAEAAPMIAEYLGKMKDYKKNEYELTDDDLRIVNEAWGFSIDALGYRKKERERNCTKG